MQSIESRHGMPRRAARTSGVIGEWPGEGKVGARSSRACDMSLPVAPERAPARQGEGLGVVGTPSLAVCNPPSWPPPQGTNPPPPGGEGLGVGGTPSLAVCNPPLLASPTSLPHKGGGIPLALGADRSGHDRAVERHLARHLRDVRQRQRHGDGGQQEAGERKEAGHKRPPMRGGAYDGASGDHGATGGGGEGFLALCIIVPPDRGVSKAR